MVRNAEESDGNNSCRRTSEASGGVCPPWWNHATASTAVSPEAMMLIAMPEITWSPRWLTQAKPCSHESNTETPQPASSASVVEPLATPAAPAAKAAKSILPSSPRSITPERSASTLASAHRMSGADTRSDEATSEPFRTSSTARLLRAHPNRSLQDHSKRGREVGRQHVGHGAGEEDDESLHGDHHVAGEARQLEGDLCPALEERAEEHAREHDAHRMAAAHQGHGDAGEARAADEVEQQLAVDPGDLIHADQAGEGARQGHGDHHLALRRDARVLRRGGTRADRAQPIAGAGAPEVGVDHEAGRDREARAHVKRCGGRLDPGPFERVG